MKDANKNHRKSEPSPKETSAETDQLVHSWNVIAERIAAFATTALLFLAANFYFRNQDNFSGVTIFFDALLVGIYGLVVFVLNTKKSASAVMAAPITAMICLQLIVLASVAGQGPGIRRRCFRAKRVGVRRSVSNWLLSNDHKGSLGGSYQ
jgi:hypothetical protein